MKNKPIIIYGNSGSRKKELALKIAKQRGTYEIINMSEFLIPFGKHSLLNRIPYTLIIDGCNNSDSHIERMKHTAVTTHLVIDSKKRSPFTIKKPNLIFIMCDNFQPFKGLFQGSLFQYLKRVKL